ncbi:MAG: carboxypeptidase regulatory-like domain-containing protein [Candidatus Cloacimonadota bacterium]|nr:MAG: carboxypeptidase regulatory-like domain-containing protein [Candidatus Cloacimonadota bacterium]
MRYSLTTIFIILLSFFGCQKKGGTPGTVGAIKGRVVYSDTAGTQGLSDAVVSAAQETTTVKSDTTDSIGYYLLCDLYPGFYDVFISAPPCAVGDSVKDVEVTSNDTTEIRDLFAWDMGVDKPNIYLYPLYPVQVNVRLVFLGFGAVTTSEPQYSNCWNVFIEPDGLINSTYGFLFYEATVPDIWQRKQGWLIEREQLSHWLWKYLPLYGFNERETNDFVEYWTQHLPLSDFYIFYPQEKGRIEQVVSLFITPQPDRILRLWFLIEPVNEPIMLQEPVIPSFARMGFTVTEWGVLGIHDHQ